MSNKKPKLFHYTDAEGARGIMATGNIQLSMGICGPGVYFTTLGPKTDKEVLIRNNYGNNPQMLVTKRNKVDYWFAFHGDDFQGNLYKLNKDDRSVYFVERPVSLREGSVINNWTNAHLL